MTTNGISKIDVTQAIDQLVATNKPVSARAIREFLGTGSMTTIVKHLREIRKTQQEQTMTISDIPEPLSNTAQQMLRDLWIAANRRAQTEVHEIRNTAAARVEASEVDVAEMLAAAEELEEQLRESEAHRAQMHEELTEVRLELVSRNAEIGLLREQCEAASERMLERCAALTLDRIAASKSDT